MLAERSDQVVSLIANTNALLAELQSQSAALDQISGNISALSQQLQGFIAENRDDDETGAGQAQRRADDHRQPQGTAAEVAQTAHPYAMSLGESVASGPVLQVLCRQPAAGPVRSAVHRRRVLRPRSGPQRAAAVGTHRPADRPAGDPGVAGAVPAHRSGRRAASDPARRDHRQSGRSGLRSARLAAARPHRLLPLPRAAAGAAARRSAAGSAALPPPGLDSTPEPTPSPVARARTR